MEPEKIEEKKTPNIVPTNEVTEWLISLSCQEYEENFWKNGYRSLDVCSDLSVDELKNHLQITKIGHVKRLNMASKQIQNYLESQRSKQKKSDFPALEKPLCLPMGWELNQDPESGRFYLFHPSLTPCYLDLKNRFSFFEPALCGPHISLSSDQKTASSSSNFVGIQVACSLRRASPADSSFFLRVLTTKKADSSWLFSIGVFAVDFIKQSFFSYGYALTNLGSILSPSSRKALISQQLTHENLNANDVVGVHVDFVESSISYSLNGRNLGVAHSNVNLMAHDLYFGCSFRAPHLGVRIVDSENE